MMKAYDPLLGETTDGDIIVVRATGRVMQVWILLCYPLILYSDENRASLKPTLHK